MARLVIFFLAHPGERFHVRDLQRRTRLSSASLQNELKRMEAVGALQREIEGDRVYYRADEEVGPWGGWMRLLRNAADPAEVVREALVDAAELEAAFIFGSVARGDAREDSDVDLFLVGPRSVRSRAITLLSNLSYFIPRPLDVIGRDRDELRSQAENWFIRSVLAEPKIWLLGNRDLVASPARAA
ncbi:MAG TPA: nucleotidyltransferase domain-containing protein, partial [Longimicrobiaceae bacterium]